MRTLVLCCFCFTLQQLHRLVANALCCKWLVGVVILQRSSTMRLIILICLASSFSSSFAIGEILFVEDFSTGFEAWTNVWGTNSVDASSGDFVLTGNNAFLVTGDPAVENLDGTSIRAQVAFEGTTSSGIGLLANGDRSALTAYQGGYNPDGDRLYIGWNNPPFYQGFAVKEADFDLEGCEELILQFDVFDNTLELWAWQPGESMPNEPQIRFVDESVNLEPGLPGVLFDANESGSSVTYRYVIVGNTPIPGGQLACDFDGDGGCDTADIDALMNEVAAGTNGATFDVNGDGLVDDGDRDAWLARAGLLNGFSAEYLVGDANLDGTVDAGDLNALALTWQSDNHNWTNGNFTGGDTNAADLNELALNWQQSVPAAAQAVPEPASMCLLLLALSGFAIRARAA
jgi:hypothetical protein